MFLHLLQDALSEGKKIKRLGWSEKTYLIKAKAVSTFELDDDECKAIGVAKGTIADPSESCLLFVNDGKVELGHVINEEDKICQDWELA